MATIEESAKNTRLPKVGWITEVRLIIFYDDNNNPTGGFIPLIPNLPSPPTQQQFLDSVGFQPTVRGLGSVVNQDAPTVAYNIAVDFQDGNGNIIFENIFPSQQRGNGIIFPARIGDPVSIYWNSNTPYFEICETPAIYLC